MQRSRAAGGIVINRETGMVLVVSQRGDSWSLPKGRLEASEDDLTAARREIAEETGVTELELLQSEPIAVYDRHAIAYGGAGENKNVLKTIVIFLFATSQSALAPADNDNPEARWVPRGDVARLLTHAKDKDVFCAVLPRLPQHP